MSSSDALRDYLRSGRFKVVQPAPIVRPAPTGPKRHILVLQRGDREKSSQVFDFDPDIFDVTFASWKSGEPFAAPPTAVSLVVVDFQDSAYADTSIYPNLARTLPDVPVIILATSEGPIDRIVALELGADDFLSKPAHPRELQARARAILRHMPTAVASGMTHGGIHLDLVERAATTERGRSKLRNVEFWLLHALMEAKGRPLGRDALLDRLQAEVKEAERDPRAVDVVISRLRRKLDTPGRESLIRTLRGRGYCV